MLLTKKIEKLTEEQKAKFEYFRNKWLKIGLATGPANRAKAEAAARKAYRNAGAKEPKLFIWLDSPMSGAYGSAMLAQVGAQVRDQVRTQVWDQVRDQVWDQVRAQVGDQVWNQACDQVRDQVWNQVWDQVRAQVGDQVWNQACDQVRDQVGDQVVEQVRTQVGTQVWSQVRTQVWDQVGAQVGAQVRDQVWNQAWDQVGAQVGVQVRTQVWNQVVEQVNRSFWSQHEAGWMSWINYFHEVCGLEFCAKADGLLELAQETGWCWFFENAVVFSQRPTEIHRDDRGRLHNTTGPALKYADGFCVYSVKGIRIDCEFIKNPALLTVKKIDEERNAEVRRVMLDLFGLEKYVSSLKPIQSDKFGELFHREVQGDEPLCVVKVKNSTPEPDGSTKDYFLRVPPTCKTAKEGVAWTFGLSEADYLPEIET